MATSGDYILHSLVLLGACQWTMMTCAHTKLNSCWFVRGHKPFPCLLNHSFHGLFFLFAKEKLRNTLSFFFHIFMMDMVSGTSSMSLLPQYLICCPASRDLLTVERFISHFVPHILPRHPPSFSSRSPPPPLSLDCLSSLPALDAFAWPDISFCCCLWPSFTLLCTLFPPRLLYKSQLFFHLNLVCVARPMSLRRSLRRLFSSRVFPTAEQLVKSLWSKRCFQIISCNDGRMLRQQCFAGYETADKDVVIFFHFDPSTPRHCAEEALEKFSGVLWRGEKKSNTWPVGSLSD